MILVKPNVADLILVVLATREYYHQPLQSNLLHHSKNQLQTYQIQIERESTDSGQIQKRDRSLRKFQAFLGMSYSYKNSGKKSMRSFHGSSLVRSHLYAWAVCTVAPSNVKIPSDIGKQLSDRYSELRKTVKGQDALIRILFKSTRFLYYELLKELVR